MGFLCATLAQIGLGLPVQFPSVAAWKADYLYIFVVRQCAVQVAVVQLRDGSNFVLTLAAIGYELHGPSLPLAEFTTGGCVTGEASAKTKKETI
jgi:hypothetical protein